MGEFSTLVFLTIGVGQDNRCGDGSGILQCMFVLGRAKHSRRLLIIDMSCVECCVMGEISYPLDGEKW